MKRHLRALGMLCLASIAHAGTAGAAPLDDAIAAFEKGNFPAALATFQTLGEQGSGAALTYLGVMRQNGSGVPREPVEAMRLYQRAAAQGYAPAQFNLGLLYAGGEGMAQDQVEARKSFHAASAQGHAQAQYQLALLYLHGQGGPADLVQAHLWFTLAESSFPASSSGDWRYKAGIQRNLAASKMTATQLAEAEQLARAWQPSVPSPQAALAAAWREARKPQTPARTSSGSGFFVSEVGHILTNAHVIEGCASTRVLAPDLAMAADILASDRRLDLAVLKIEHRAPEFARLRPTVRQGEPVAIYGFPLAGLLSSGGNFTTDGVTALTGLRDNASQLQISAPVQPGNSGGPLLDESGNVVGVVVSRLNARKAETVPQNINFAVKASEATSFLAANGVRHAEGKLQDRLSPSDVADRARSFVVRIECKRPLTAAVR